MGLVFMAKCKKCKMNEYTSQRSSKLLGTFQNIKLFAAEYTVPLQLNTR